MSNFVNAIIKNSSDNSFNNYDMFNYFVYNNSKSNSPHNIYIAPSLSYPHVISSQYTNLSNNSFVQSTANNISISVDSLNADSGSSGNYVSIRDMKYLTQLQPCTNSTRISVKVANGQVIHSSHIGKLVLPSGHTVPAHTFAEMHGSLLSVSSLVDIGYKVLYSAEKVEFILNSKTVFEGQRDIVTRMWMVNFAVFAPLTQTASPVVEVNNKKEYVAYWHATFGYPSKTSFIRNIRNKNIMIDGLTVESVRRNFVPSVFTAMGHLDATRSNIKSTKPENASEGIFAI